MTWAENTQHMLVSFIRSIKEYAQDYTMWKEISYSASCIPYAQGQLHGYTANSFCSLLIYTLRCAEIDSHSLTQGWEEWAGFSAVV